MLPIIFCTLVICLLIFYLFKRKNFVENANDTCKNFFLQNYTFKNVNFFFKAINPTRTGSDYSQNIYTLRPPQYNDHMIDINTMNTTQAPGHEESQSSHEPPAYHSVVNSLAASRAILKSESQRYFVNTSQKIETSATI